MTQMFSINGVTAPPTPGQVLKAKLIDAIGLTQAQLARAIGISTPRLNMILKGRCQINAEIALRIERVFDISPQYWLRIRNEYELYEDRERFSHQLDRLPQLDVLRERHSSAWDVREWQAAA
jgi:addiction module HigA family antidote